MINRRSFLFQLKKDPRIKFPHYFIRWTRRKRANRPIKALARRKMNPPEEHPRIQMSQLLPVILKQ